MKKLINLVCIIFLWSSFVFGNSAADANRNTALRCLKIAESCLMGGDWNNALKQAELGLTYDDSISDLIYLKAAAEIKLNTPKKEVIELIESAFLKNQWVGYTVNGARILYADLLSDVGRYEKSMSVLDDEPFILSADAEFIRIKNLYRTGTSETLKNARLKVNSSRRIYPKDSRFPKIFFMFELMFKNEAERIGMNYEIPEIVKTIASSYIANLPDYKGDNLDIELMASFFADDDERSRLVKAIDAKDSTRNSLLAIAGLETGLYSQQQAFDLFFDCAADSIHLGLLENFALKLNDDNVKKQFVEKMLNYNGKIFIDENLDLQPELNVSYDTGRPHTINYDSNNDGILDLFCSCDYGAPNLVYIGLNKAKIFYSQFPNVSKISFDDKDYVLNFLSDDYKMSLVQFSTNNILGNFGLDFYIPSISKDIIMPDLEDLLLSASSVEYPTIERENSKVTYTSLEGKLVSADFFENDRRFGYCDFSEGFPITRFVDKDNDGYFETKEIYNISTSEDDFITEDEINHTKSVFNLLPFKNNVYLKKVLVDNNGNTFNEFSEEYLGLNGKITIWDSDDNGIPDIQFIKYPLENENQLKEDSIFFDENGSPFIIINMLNKIPVKMTYKDSEVMIFAGKSDNFYWIEEEGNINTEKYILENFGKKLLNGVIQIVSFEESRVNVIKINDNIFCKIINPSEVDLIQE